MSGVGRVRGDQEGILQDVGKARGGPGPVLSQAPLLMAGQLG